MPANPTVTWMIPVLNGMPYLPITLRSIEQQTFKDFQVVIWDNGSSDGTVEEARRWIPSRLPGVVIVDRPMLLGLARAAMVQEFDTEFCALIDADDVNHSDRLARQMEFMTANPEIAVLGTQLWRISSSGENLGPFSDYPLRHEQIVQEMLVANPIAQPSVLFRRAAVLAVGNYRDFSPTHVEDYDLWLRMAASGYRLANLPDRLVDYRVHEKSTTQKSVAVNRLDAEMLRRLCEAAPELFGCPGDTIELLRLKKSTCAASAIGQIARHLRDEKPVWRSPIFHRAAQQMIAKTDLQSRAIVAMKSRGVVGLASESRRAMMDLVRYIRRVIRGK